MAPQNLVRLALMLTREMLSPPRLERRAEPMPVMSETESVAAFHDQGAPAGPLLPVYRFNARAASRLLPPGGVVLDLGAGSGQYLAYLAARRPDIKAIGIDLSAAMIDRGRQSLETTGVAGRVELLVGDMTNFLHLVPARVDLVSSVFALHHLPTADHLGQCLAQIAQLRSRSKCAVWIFDHVRPRSRKTPEVFPLIFTPGAPRVFQEDSRNSLIAAFSAGELSTACRAAGLGGSNHSVAQRMALYQVHWGASGHPSVEGHRLWQDHDASPLAMRDYRGLCRLFPDLKSLVR